MKVCIDNDSCEDCTLVKVSFSPFCSDPASRDSLTSMHVIRIGNQSNCFPENPLTQSLFWVEIARLTESANSCDGSVLVGTGGILRRFCWQLMKAEKWGWEVKVLGLSLLSQTFVRLNRIRGGGGKPFGGEVEGKDRALTKLELSEKRQKR
ncbi:hypothetical protein ACLOJK_003407 [Asimina triloba]